MPVGREDLKTRKDLKTGRFKNVHSLIRKIDLHAVEKQIKIPQPTHVELKVASGLLSRSRLQ